MVLSPPKCILLAVQYATDSNFAALRTLTTQRPDVLKLDLVLQVILTFLPESTEPSFYTEFLYDLVEGGNLQDDDAARTSLELSDVEKLSEAQAHKKIRNLQLLPLGHTTTRHEPPLDSLTLFLIHRAYQIDQATGLLELIPSLVVPFLDRSDYLQTWFVSTVLPLLRLGYEYYPDSSIPQLEKFSQMRGAAAIEALLSGVQRSANDPAHPRDLGRDLRGVIGPWMYGYSQRQERLQQDRLQRRMSTSAEVEIDDWEHLFRWLLDTSRSDFGLISAAISDWNGPGDADLGGYDESGKGVLSEESINRLRSRYAQTVLASLYTLENNEVETLRRAQFLLQRIASLLGLQVSLDLDVAVESFPQFNNKDRLTGPKKGGDDKTSTDVLKPEAIFEQDNLLTRPESRNFHLLDLFIFSAYTLAGMQYQTSLKELAELYLDGKGSEQFLVVRKLLHKPGSPRKDEIQWRAIRTRVLWLWSWGVEEKGTATNGHGIFGKVDIKTVESEILKVLVDEGHYSLAVELYTGKSTESQALQPGDVENIVLSCAMGHYDNASNGNRTRGGMKKASDIVAAFSPSFPSSARFLRMQALLKATHALSFYSLTLQHGVPFQPVNIRVMEDPLTLIEKVLSQHKGSYTELDNLIKIGTALIYSNPAHILDQASNSGDEPQDEEIKKATERRIIGMAMEGALDDGDFETAYTYGINRLPRKPRLWDPALLTGAEPPSFEKLDELVRQERQLPEDPCWRAAFNAGCYEAPAPEMSSSQPGLTIVNPQIRRLEQRMELLSRTLILAPFDEKANVLQKWTECEDDFVKLLTEEAEEEKRFNEAADRAVAHHELPGAFPKKAVTVQPRREVGRGAVEESPMGLFEVAKGAAEAFSRSAFPLRGSMMGSTGPAARVETGGSSARSSLDSQRLHDGEEGRVRKRDMVANAVTGGLASGLGWVLGANPVDKQ